MKHVMDELKAKGFTDEKFNKWVNNPNVKKIYSPEQLEILKLIWAGKPEEVEEEKVEEVIAATLESFTKDELDEYANSVHGIDLDKRFSKAKMIQELHDKLNEQK